MNRSNPGSSFNDATRERETRVRGCPHARSSLSRLGAKAKAITLAGSDPDADNTLDQPDRVNPRQSDFVCGKPSFTYTVEPYSLTTLRIPQ